MSNDLVQSFIAESGDRLSQIEQALDTLEKKANPDCLATLIRDIHSLKAAAYAADLNHIGEILHRYEDLLDTTDKTTGSVETATVMLGLECAQEVKKQTQSIPDTPPYDRANIELLEKLDLFVAFAKGDVSVNLENQEPASEAPDELDKKIEEANEPVEPFNPEEFSDKEMLDSITEDITGILEELTNQLIDLEKNPADPEVIDKIFREIHTIKGDSAMIPIPQVSKLAHYMENIFDAIRNGIYAVDNDIMDLVFKGIDYFEGFLKCLRENQPLNLSINAYLVDLIKLDHHKRDTQAPPETVTSEPKVQEEPSQDNDVDTSLNRPVDTIRVNVERLNNGMNLVSELVTNKIRSDERLKFLNTLILNLNQSARIIQELHQSTSVSQIFGEFEKKIRHLLHDAQVEDLALYSDEISQLQSTIEQLTSQVSVTTESVGVELKGLLSETEETVDVLRSTMDNLGTITGGLQENLMKTRMLPVSTVFNRFPRMVRELSRERDKEVALDIEGRETELDKNVIEKIGDPIMHIVRNSIDHGLETPQERESLGKPRSGTIQMTARYEGNQVIIEVIDDGKGIDIAKVRDRAIERDIITEQDAERLDDAEIRDIIFAPGFSTAAEITNISGRGVGLDVVKANIMKLKGSIDVDSVPLQGTTFKIRLPLTLAIVQVLIIKCATETLALPLSYIDKTIVISPQDIKQSGSIPLINHLGQTVPIINLANVLELDQTDASENLKIPVIIVVVDKAKYALAIDGINGRLEVVIKNLGDVLKNVQHVAGATIMGDGSIVLILDVPGIITTVMSQTPKRSVAAESGPDLPQQLVEEGYQKNVLVVEDSDTVRRSITKEIQAQKLTSIEAENGQIGLELAGSKPIDLFLIDIMMPVMDGFALTEKLRRIPRYQDTPIVIISSKDKKADKDKAFELGATDYLTKPFRKEALGDLLKKYLKSTPSNT